MIIKYKNISYFDVEIIGEASYLDVVRDYKDRLLHFSDKGYTTKSIHDVGINYVDTNVYDISGNQKVKEFVEKRIIEKRDKAINDIIG